MKEELIAKRKHLNKTQEEVAEEAGISRTAYANIERGIRRPSPEAAKRISKVLNVPWTSFFE